MAFALACAISLWLLIALVVFGRRARDFSHARDSISALGMRGARDERAMSYGVFLPVGCGALLVAWRLRAAPGPFADPAAWLALAIAAGYLIAAVCHLDPSCIGPPLRLRPGHVLHLVGAVIEYGSAVLLLLLKGWDLPAGWRVASLGTAAAIATCGLLLTWGAVAPVRGALQRLTDGLIFGWLILLTAAAG